MNTTIILITYLFRTATRRPSAIGLSSTTGGARVNFNEQTATLPGYSMNPNQPAAYGNNNFNLNQTAPAASSSSSAMRVPSRPQSAGPMGRGRLNPQFNSTASAAYVAPDLTNNVGEGNVIIVSLIYIVSKEQKITVLTVLFYFIFFTRAVDDDVVLKEAKNIQRDAVLCYNGQQYAAAEAKFQDVYQVMLMLYPEEHPECVRALKSVQMVQRKLAEVGNSSSGGGGRR